MQDGHSSILLNFVIDASSASVEKIVNPRHLCLPLPNLPSTARNGSFHEEITAVIVAIGIDCMAVPQVLREGGGKRLNRSGAQK